MVVYPAVCYGLCAMQGSGPICREGRLQPSSASCLELTSERACAAEKNTRSGEEGQRLVVLALRALVEVVQVVTCGAVVNEQQAPSRWSLGHSTDSDVGRGPLLGGIGWKATAGSLGNSAHRATGPDEWQVGVQASRSLFF